MLTTCCDCVDLQSLSKAKLEVLVHQRRRLQWCGTRRWSDSVGSVPELAPLQLGSPLQLITVQLQCLLVLLLIHVTCAPLLCPGRASHPEHILHTYHCASQLYGTPPSQSHNTGENVGVQHTIPIIVVGRYLACGSVEELHSDVGIDHVASSLHHLHMV